MGDEKLTSREDLIGLLFFYVQSDEDTFLKAYDRQWTSTHEVFWQYPLVTSSQLGVVRPFDGLDLIFGSFSQRLMS